jgi:Protein of unknown function (DUF3489)
MWGAARDADGTIRFPGTTRPGSRRRLRRRPVLYRRRARCSTSRSPNEAIAKIAVGAAIATTPEIAATKPATGKPRDGTKIARVIELLRRDQGAALDELIAATGWLPHTARAALTGLRHRGYDVRLERGDKDRASVYRVFEAMAS